MELLWNGCTVLCFLDLRYCALRLASFTILRLNMVSFDVRLGTCTLSSSANSALYSSRPTPHFEAIMVGGRLTPSGVQR